LNQMPCYAVAKSGMIVSDEFLSVCLRDIYLDGENELAAIAGYAKQMADWNTNFRFCGRCASPTVVLSREHARQCPKCQLVNYPRISPAIIAAVIKDDQILLARGHNSRDKEMFSVLAGFLEAGESLEEAVKREILEEVGIEVTNVQYVRSQPWPFPDSLMIGFTADYLRGDIKIDDNEIVEARWFKADALPKVPQKRSISSELIRGFVAANRK
ncbi:MAG: NAD(+) diphosphatase, partial [Candidatus Omnitrophota bacterium]